MHEIHYISKAYETVWGFSMQSLYANPQQWTDAILAEDRERVQATFVGLTEDVPSVSVEYRIVRPDGTVRWIHDRGFQVRDSAGRPVRNAGVATDITELKLAAESLKKSEAHQSAIVESALDCIITVDAQGFITEFNPSAEETFGHQRAAVLGKQLADVIVSLTWRADNLKRMEDYLAAGEPETRALGKRIERSAVRADGTEFPVEIAMSTATIQGQRSITLFIRDITERKSAERRVEALHKELLETSRRAGMAEVATGVLHNVGNVLNSINVSTSIVVERLQKSRVSRLTEVVKLLADHAGDLTEFLTVDERGRNLPEFLAQLATHLNRETHEIVEEMQAVAGNVDHVKEIISTQQSYAGSFGVLEPIDLRDAIEDALRIHGGALDRHRVEIVRKLEPIAAVVVDKHKVLQILVNLISNAKYAMTDSPVKTLTIKTYPSSDGGIQVSLHDTGCGIVAENITRIFSHGFTTKKDGHGFGLHSSALAAKEMNALLIASSDGVGQGAVFTLVFPPAVSGQMAA
jgi:PAS domain S-box-containing protein